MLLYLVEFACNLPLLCILCGCVLSSDTLCYLRILFGLPSLLMNIFNFFWIAFSIITACSVVRIKASFRSQGRKAVVVFCCFFFPLKLKILKCDFETNDYMLVLNCQLHYLLLYKMIARTDGYG